MAFGPFVFGVVALCELAVILFSDFKTLLNLFAFNKYGRMHLSDAEAGVASLFQKKHILVHF